MTKPKPTIEKPKQRHDDHGVELEAYLAYRARVCPSVSVAFAMADPEAKARIREVLDARTQQFAAEVERYLGVASVGRTPKAT